MKLSIFPQEYIDFNKEIMERINALKKISALHLDLIGYE